MRDRRLLRVALLGSVGVSAALSLAPLTSRLLLNGHDASQYVPRTVEFHQSVLAGQIPPVWAAHLSAGHGQPLFQFAPPLLYALGEPFYALGLGIARSIQLPLIGVFVFGSFALFHLASRLAGETAGYLAAVAFLFAPYVHIDLYVRAAWAEALALALTPALLLAVLRTFESANARSVTWLGLATAALMLTHPPGFLMGMAIAGAFALALAGGRRDKGALARCAAGVLLGLGISAFFWIPAFVEKSATKTYLLRFGDLDYAQHFLAPLQLLHGKWGFGLSVAGPADGMPFELGKAHLVLAAAGLVSALRSGDRVQRWVAIAAALLTLAACGLTLAPSRPVWEALPLLQNFAYPWRMLFFPALLLPLLVALLGRSLRAEWTIVLIALLVATNLGHTVPPARHAVDALDSPEEIARQDVRTTYYNEYEPRTAPRDSMYQRHLLEARDPDAAGRLIALTPERQLFEIDTPRRSRFVLRTYHYPGWTVLVDGRETFCWAERYTGRIAFDAGPGRHLVTVELRPTIVRRLASLLSLATLLSIAAVTLSRARRHRAAALPSAAGPPA